LGYNTYIHGNVTKKLPVQLPETHKNEILFLLQNGEQEGRTGLIRGEELVPVVGGWRKSHYYF
jgi:hypothetical protein